MSLIKKQRPESLALAVILVLTVIFAVLWPERNVFILLILAVVFLLSLETTNGLNRENRRKGFVVAGCVLGSFALGLQLKWPSQIIERFHELYYDRAESTWFSTSWLGVQVLKNPLDAWVFQEIIHETRPDTIVEAGTYRGGSAFFLANLFDLLGRGKVVTIDIVEMAGRPHHPRIEYLIGSSTDPRTIEQVKAKISPGDKVMVVLDSDHHKANVLAELRAYGPLVTKGNYMIVEDTDINGHPVYRSFGPGPMEAVEEFLPEDSSFAADRSREKFLLTHNPKGYLKKVR